MTAVTHMPDAPVRVVVVDILLIVTDPFSDPDVQAAAATAAAALRAGGALYAETNESTIRHRVPGLLNGVVLKLLDNAAAGEPSQVSTQAPLELSPDQVAAELNVSRNYVRKLIDEETLPHRRVGNRFRVPRAAVMAYKLQQDRASQRALNELVDLTGDLYIPGRQQ